MANPKFPILGTSVPPMLGRDAVMQGMLSSLTKSVPDHLQVVGPKFAGKSVILHEISRRISISGDAYAGIILWDLGHLTPDSDDIFMQRLAKNISNTIRATHAECADHLDSATGNPYQEIGEVLDHLKGDNSKLLAILDGFDRPLSNGLLTRNLWDQLRDLALRPNLRLITASRNTLRELIRSPDAQTSDFWNIFAPTPVRVGCFDNNDIEAILATVPDLQFTPGAKTELWNASNGFPVFMFGILNEVVLFQTTGVVSPEAIKKACDRAFPSLSDKVDALWVELPTSSRDLMWRVLQEGEVARAGISTKDADILTERGFAHSQSNKLTRPSRLVGRYLKDQPQDGSALVHLFGTVDGYEKYFKSVLERRIGQITGINPKLKHYFERGAGDLPDHPDIFLTNIRGIVDLCFDLIWSAEIPDKRIPSQWMSVWKRNDEAGIDDLETTFPQGGRRLRLLNLMTGTVKSTACAKYVTKSTYAFMNAVHTFGDFGQHQEGTPVDSGTAYAVFHLCIELAAVLNRELPAGH
jgi:hypothetical protein